MISFVVVRKLYSCGSRSSAPTAAFLGGLCSAGCCCSVTRRVADRAGTVGWLRSVTLRPCGLECVLPLLELPVQVEHADGQRDQPQAGEERADDQGSDQTHAHPLEPEDTDDRVHPPQDADERPALLCGLLQTPAEVVPQGPHGGLVVQRRILRRNLADLDDLAVDAEDCCDPPRPDEHETDGPAQPDDDVALERERLAHPEEERRHDHRPKRDGEPQRAHLLPACHEPVDAARRGALGPGDVVTFEFLLVETEVDRLGQFPDRSHGADHEADRDDGRVGRDDDSPARIEPFSEETAGESEEKVAESS